MVKDFFSQQLERWPETASRYHALAECSRRDIELHNGIGKATIMLLFNPARAVSTAAKVDAASIAGRPCFLCSTNRPQQQLVDNSLLDEGFEVLVNPFPILSPHFTIASIVHKPQDDFPIEAMTKAARLYPNMVFFYNGARAGASAPDHLHFQAVARKDVPLLRVVGGKHNSGHGSCTWSGNLGIAHPAAFLSLVNEKGALPAIPDKDLANLFVWRDDDGNMRMILFPRRRHRASGYPEPMVSPGALDVAGLMVTVREKDFRNLTAAEVADIYATTCYSPTDNPPLV